MKEVKIKVKYGSPYQEEFGDKLLKNILVAYFVHMESAHQKNSVSIEWVDFSWIDVWFINSFRCNFNS